MQTNLHYLFIDQLPNFAHLVTPEKQTKEQFAERIKSAYDIGNPKTHLFYLSLMRSDFETLRLNKTRDAILFNQ